MHKKKTGYLDEFIKVTELKQKIEDIYYSKTPRPTKANLLIQLLQIYKSPIPEGIVNSHYSLLEKKNKKTDIDFKKILQTKEGTRFELFKYRFYDQNPPITKFIICYCSDFQKSKISECKYIFIDGTFSITPEPFYQVLVISGQTLYLNLPLAFILLPDKSQGIYEKAFTLFKTESKALFQPGTIFITDFERAEYNAVKKILMDKSHYFQFCYFHYTQILRRYFANYPNFKYLNRLTYIAYQLPFIPLEMVNEVITELYKHSETRNFALYFEKNFINNYDFEEWNCYNKPNKQTITNNFAESINSTLNDKIKKGPTFEEFELGLVEVENEYFLKSKTRVLQKLDIKRIDSEAFKKLFKNFITNIIRGIEDDEEIPENIQNNDSSNDDSYFLNENEDNLEKYPNDILISSDTEEIDDEQQENCEEQNKDDNNVEERNEIVPSDLLEEASSRPKANIRGLPSAVIQVLQENIIQFNRAQPRSAERNAILNSTLARAQEIEPTITRIQIRSWFNNNKNKVQ